jgi:hypothetical protein
MTTYPDGPHDIAVRAQLNAAHRKPKESPEVRAERFITDNPHVWESFDKLVQKAAKAGKTHIGVAMIFELLRWNHMFQTKDNTPFKLNNTYRAHFARRWMKLNPNFPEMFEIRELKS